MPQKTHTNQRIFAENARGDRFYLTTTTIETGGVLYRLAELREELKRECPRGYNRLYVETATTTYTDEPIA